MFFTSNPPCNNRLPQGIFPNLIDSDTSCHELAPARLGSLSRLATCGFGLFRTNSPGLPHFRTTRLVGPPSMLSHERELSQLHPRYLPPLGLPLPRELNNGSCFVADLSTPPQSPDAFVTHRHISLDRLDVLWARSPRRCRVLCSSLSLTTAAPLAASAFEQFVG